MFVLLARVHSWFVKLSHSSLEPPCKHGSGAHITSLADVFHQVHQQRGHLPIYSVETERTAEFEKKFTVSENRVTRERHKRFHYSHHTV